MRLILPILFFLAAPVWAQAPSQGAGDGFVLNFRDAQLPAFIEDVAMITGRTFIVDPRVSGTVTVVSDVPLDQLAVLDVFNATLEVNGFAALPTTSGAFKIVPHNEAARAASPLVDRRLSGERFITSVLALRFISAGEAVELLRPIAGPGGTVLANQQRNFVLVVDVAANVARMRDILARADQDRSAIETIELGNIAAAEVAAVIEQLAGLEGGRDGGANRRNSSFVVIPVESSNVIILKGDPAAIARFAPVVRDLDRRGGQRGDIKVLHPRHASAQQLAPLLEQVANKLALPVNSGEGDGAAVGSANQASIAVFEETNALVISADAEIQKTLEKVVSELDVRRAQVLVEAIIVEVSDTAARELGVQYVLGGANNNIPFTATSFSSSAPNILAATGAAVFGDGDPGNGELSGGTLETLQQAALTSLLGLNGFAGGFAGQTSGGTLFGVILNALEQDSSSNILSTPSVTVLDNAAARLLVGQEIPIATGEVLAATNTNPFRTVERQDVGVQLEVSPQINEGDLIQLDIRQEVSSVIGPVTDTSADLITSVREVETSVLVDNGEIVILGGLIEDNEQISFDKVPLLGDIPYLGRLFRSENRSKVRTNLMVFLRPTIVRSRQDFESATRRKYDYIRAEQLLRSRDNESSIDDFMDNIIGTNPHPRGADYPADGGR